MHEGDFIELPSFLYKQSTKTENKVLVIVFFTRNLCKKAVVPLVHGIFSLILLRGKFG